MADNVLATPPKKQRERYRPELLKILDDYAARVANDFTSGLDRSAQGFGEMVDDGNYLTGVPRLALGGLQWMGSPVSAAVSPILGPVLQPVGEAVDTYVGQPVERATGYPADITNELFLTGVTAGAGPLLKPALKGTGNFLATMGDAAEAGLNRVGYTARPQAGTFFSGGGPVKLADDEGILAYHGSPHSFDKFSMDKIGTGEGAQAYGHGLYFADAERVANSYRGSPELKYARLNGHMSAAEEIAYDMAMQNNPDWSHDAWKAMRSRGIADDQIFDAIDKIQPGRGSMYQVRLNVKPDELLDWDKPLTGQPDIVQKALAGWRLTPSGVIDDRPLGEVLDMPQRYKDGSDILLTDDLKKAGIKGIRYLDAGSRDGRGGTYNYVIFDDKLITILKKYGIPMTAGAGGAMMVSGEAMPPEVAAQLQNGT